MEHDRSLILQSHPLTLNLILALAIVVIIIILTYIRHGTGGG
jgi:hypothetical protein